MEHLEHTQISIQLMYRNIFLDPLYITHNMLTYIYIYIWKAGRGENIEKEFSQSIYNLL